ncbi:hypothetical protein SAMN05720781_0001, partial [Fibrobacter sp. UWT3]|uniref:hypothetical protein n=1 Tax=Fibrobacter sp. UWT3 TaxID=1896225 RepID=UPI000BC6FF04
ANGIEFEGRQMMQHFGFISIPKAGERCLFLQFGNVVIAVASDGRTIRRKEGERPFTAKGTYIILRTMEHRIKAEGVLISMRRASQWRS